MSKTDDHDHPSPPEPAQPETAGVEGSAPPAGRRRRIHHPWRLAIGMVVALVVVASAVPTVRYLLRSHPGAKSVDSAVQRYRTSTTEGTGSATEFQGPQLGVYEAHGTGHEQISFPPNSQDDGAVMPITVSALSKGCWRWRIDYNTAHWHEYDFCPDKGALLLVAQGNFQRWDFGSLVVTNLGSYTCSPPAPIVVEGARTGQTYEHHCTGTNTAAAGISNVDGPATIAGTTTLTIGDQKVEALHQTRVEHLTGSQQGTVTEQWWFDTRTGLPLRAERHYQVTSPSPIGNVDYAESGSWQLASMHPST